MPCYKDITFCRFYKECAKGHDCRKALTEEVRQGAIDWGLPIYEYISEPHCFVPIVKT